MYKLLVFLEDKYKEYPLSKPISIGKDKFYEQDNQIYRMNDELKEPLELNTIYKSNADISYMCMGDEVNNYERIPNMWIGRDKGDIQIHNLTHDIYVEHNKLHIRSKDAGATQESSIPIYLNGERFTEEEHTISIGDMLFLEGTKVTLFEHAIEIEGALSSYETHLAEVRGVDEYFEGFPAYRRSPRVIKRVKEEKIEIKNPPQKANMAKGSIASIIIPPLTMMAVTVGMGIVMKKGSYVFASAGMTVITLLFSVYKFFNEQKENTKKNKDREKIYRDYLLKVRKKARNLRDKEKEILFYQNPGLHELEDMVKNYSNRIYERSGLDDDFLTLNLGYQKGESAIQVRYKDTELELDRDELVQEAISIQDDFGRIESKPLIIDLKKAHLGLVGDKSCIHEQLKVYLAQLTFMQSYHDLEIIFIYQEAYKNDFDYIKWYPHIKIHSINVTGQVYNDRMRDQILGSILQILKDRKSKLEENKQETKFLPHFLFIIDDPKLIVNHAIMEFLQSKLEGLALSIIYTTNLKGNLPENMHTVGILENSTKGTLLLNEGEMVNKEFSLAHADGVDLEQMARDLSVLHHEKGMTSNIPESINFFEMYQVQTPKELNVEQRWEKNESHKSLAVPLGVRAKEDYVDLNLHEKAHGPHGLVAGTTGSGKSEIIQSYILSLAVNFHPYEVGFLLIDYKGGGMAGLFEKLPHLLGTITNLDGAESTRAMASIKSELARRQRIFSDHNVNHINGYNKLFKLGKVDEPLPHLFLISDEFAELKKEQPDFMSELVSAARIGRSLGIHLILATQKPSGVVDDQIWTNSKFKLCLKVQNESDSKEMLKTPDAANITQAGRSYLQVGNNEIYELFQSAWSGAPYTDEEKEEEVDDRVYLVNSLGQGEVINQDLSGSDESNKIKATQLDVVIDHIYGIFKQKGIEQVRRPWLPSLEHRIKSPHMDHIVDTSTFTKGDISVYLGLVDIPEEQKQEEYLYDFVQNGHLLYIASSGYGKSVFIGTILMGLAVKNSTRNLDMYIIDLGNSALVPYRGLPQVADYLTIDDTEKVVKFMALIYQEMKERKQKLAKAMVQNFEVYNQSSIDQLKAIVIAIDNFDVVKELGYEVEEFFLKVSRDGASLGIYLIVTATRTNAMKYAVMNNFKVKIAGYNFEESEPRSIVGRSEYTLPEVKGRAMVKINNVNIMQIYTPVDFQTDMEYSANLKKVIEQISTLSSEEKAHGIPILPDILAYDELPIYPRYEEDRTRSPIGIDVEDLEVQYIDLKEPLQLIIGGSQSGKTNTLKNILHTLKEEEVFLVDSSSMELYSYHTSENIHYMAERSTIETFIDDLENMVDRREDEYRIKKEEAPGLLPKMFYQSLPPTYILIDMVQEFMENLEAIDNGDAEEVLVRAANVGINIVATSSVRVKSRSKFGAMVKEAKCGLVLGDIKEQTVFSNSGFRESNNQVDIGYLQVKGDATKVKLPKYLS